MRSDILSKIEEALSSIDIHSTDPEHFAEKPKEDPR